MAVLCKVTQESCDLEKKNPDRPEGVAKMVLDAANLVHNSHYYKLGSISDERIPLSPLVVKKLGLRKYGQF